MVSCLISWAKVAVQIKSSRKVSIRKLHYIGNISSWQLFFLQTTICPFTGLLLCLLKNRVLGPYASESSHSIDLWSAETGGFRHLMA